MIINRNSFCIALQTNKKDAESQNHLTIWEFRSSNEFASNIAVDIATLLSVYKNITVEAQESISSSHGVMIINCVNEKIEIGFMATFLKLGELYSSALYSQDWCNFAEAGGDIIKTVDARLSWLCSVANDLQSIMSDHALNFHGVFTNSVDTNTVGQEMFLREQHIETLNITTMSMYKSLSILLNIAMESAACLIFSRLDSLYANRSLYSNWTEFSSSDYMNNIFEQINRFLSARAEFLSKVSLTALLEQCLNKVMFFYYALLNECKHNSIRFVVTDFERLSSDFQLVNDFFMAFMSTRYTEDELKTTTFYSMLDEIETLRSILCDPADSLDYTVLLYSYFDGVGSKKEKVLAAINIMECCLFVRDISSANPIVSKIISDLKLKYEKSFDEGDNNYGTRNAAITVFGYSKLKPDITSFKSFMTRSVLNRYESQTAALQKEKLIRKASDLTNQLTTALGDKVANLAVSIRPSESQKQALGGLKHIIGNIMHNEETSGKLILKLSQITLCGLISPVNIRRHDPIVKFSIGKNVVSTSAIYFNENVTWDNLELNLPLPQTNDSKIMCSVLFHRAMYLPDIEFGSILIDIGELLDERLNLENKLFSSVLELRPDFYSAKDIDLKPTLIFSAEVEYQ